MRYLVKTTETYRLQDEKEVENFLADLKADSSFELVKYSSVKKERKQKGEVIDEWIQFTVTKAFNEEKEPTDIVDIEYTRR